MRQFPEVWVCLSSSACLEDSGVGGRGPTGDAAFNELTLCGASPGFAVTSTSEGGYQMEFRVRKAALLGVSEEDRLGFNIALNDGDGDGRKAQLNWAGAPHREFSYGGLVLGGAASSAKAGATDVTLTRSAQGIVLQWEGNGILQTATSVTGPWGEVVGAASGVEISFTAAEAFYRVR